MRVAYVSHSLVNPRQALFAEALDEELGGPGTRDGVIELYPSSWGDQSRSGQGGFRVLMEGDIVRYRFPARAWHLLEDRDPDVLLVQQEPYSRTARDAVQFCEDTGATLVLFTWENQHHPEDTDSVPVLDAADHVVCGNPTAKNLVLDAVPGASTSILPQVGIDPDLFAPDETVETEWDILATGRPNDPMKGLDLLHEAAEDEPWTVATREDLDYVAYEDLRHRYNRARVHACPSQDVQGKPREQYAPSANVEAMLCGTPLVVSDQDAIHYWLWDRWDTPPPGVWFHNEGDPEDLNQALHDALLSDTAARGEQLRAWAVPRFGNETVAAAYATLFETLLEDPARA